MARPIVIVYQETDVPQVTLVTPDLNTVFVGPCYLIKQYPEDAAEILLGSAYGQLQQPAGGASQYTPPTSGTDAVTVSAYPGNAAGALVDPASVRFTLSFPRVSMGATYAGCGTVYGANCTTSATVGEENKVTVSGADFVTAGVQAGDTVILTSSIGTQTAVRTVLSVGEPDASGVVTDATSLRLTANLPAAGGGADAWTYNSSGELRIERTLATQSLVDSTGAIVTFPEAGSTTCVVRGGVTLGVTVGGATVQKPLSYAQLYVSYRALRQDLQAPVRVSGADVRTAGGISSYTTLGRIDAQNPLAAAVFVGLQNAGSSPVYAFGVTSNDAAGHLAARAAMSARRDLHTFVPLTQDTNVVAGYKFAWEDLASPDYALENGVPQIFRVVLGNAPLPTSRTVAEPSITGEAIQQAGTATGRNRTLTFAGTPSIDLSAVLPGDTITIGLVAAGGAWSGRRGAHKVAHVNSTTAIEIEPGTSRWNDAASDSAGGTEVRITSPTGTVKFQRTAFLELLTTGDGVRFEANAPTTVGGPYRVRFVDTGDVVPVVSISGFDITVNLDATVTTYQAVVDAVNAHAAVSSVVTASLVGSDVAVPAAVAFTALAITTTECSVTISANDTLYLRLSDTNAAFITAGVKVGDTVEIPIDVNNYLSTAFDGRVLSYTVAQIPSETSLLVQNLGDDKAAVATELPHGYMRDLPSRAVDNTPGGSPAAALHYRVRRKLSTDDQITALIAIAQGFRSKRVTLCWPDEVTVKDLQDATLPRTVATTPAPAARQPGWMIAAQVGGALAGLPVQQGLTNLGLAGVAKLYHSSNYFDEAQLSKLSDGGWFVMHQRVDEELPFCIHQLTTDVTALQTGELSVVKNVDFVSVFLQVELESFLGRYNAIAEALDDALTSMNAAIEDLKGRKMARIGPPLLSGEVTSIKFSDVAADRMVIRFKGKVPNPLNQIDLHVVL